MRLPPGSAYGGLNSYHSIPLNTIDDQVGTCQGGRTCERPPGGRRQPWDAPAPSLGSADVGSARPPTGIAASGSLGEFTNLLVVHVFTWRDDRPRRRPPRHPDRAETGSRRRGTAHRNRPGAGAGSGRHPGRRRPTPRTHPKTRPRPATWQTTPCTEPTQTDDARRTATRPAQRAAPRPERRLRRPAPRPEPKLTRHSATPWATGRCQRRRHHGRPARSTGRTAARERPRRSDYGA